MQYLRFNKHQIIPACSTMVNIIPSYCTTYGTSYCMEYTVSHVSYTTTILLLTWPIEAMELQTRELHSTALHLLLVHFVSVTFPSKGRSSTKEILSALQLTSKGTATRSGISRWVERKGCEEERKRGERRELGWGALMQLELKCMAFRK